MPKTVMEIYLTLNLEILKLTVYHLITITQHLDTIDHHKIWNLKKNKLYYRYE